MYEDYGVSEDPLQLQTQVRELKVQLESQTKLILQMQSLLRRSSLPSDLFANASDPSIIRDQEGTHREDQAHDKSYRGGQLREKKEGENQAMKDKTSRLNMELERERALNRSMSEQLQQTRSRSTSPARSTCFFSYQYNTIFTLSECYTVISETLTHAVFCLLALILSSPQTGLSGAVSGQGAVTTEAADQGES